MWRYLTVIALGALAGSLVSAPAWAAGLGEARRGFGVGSALGLVCCLVVAGLIAIGLVIGLTVGRRRRGSGS
jgi:hypothetical protein